MSATRIKFSTEKFDAISTTERYVARDSTTERYVARDSTTRTVRGSGQAVGNNGIYDTWILGVVSKQLRLLHGRVGDSTTLVKFLSPQMSELVEDAVAS